jgi:hypothetical protein
MRMTTRESIRVENVNDLHGSFGDAIPKTFERGAAQGRSTVTVVDVLVARQYDASILYRALAQRDELAIDGRLLRLTLRRDSCVQCYRLGHDDTFSPGEQCGSAGCGRGAGSSPLRVGVRRTVATTRSYANSNCCADDRVGSNAMRTRSTRRMERHNGSEQLKSQEND